MKLFKAKDTARSPEDEVAYARLMAVADRSRPRDTVDSMPMPSLPPTRE